MEQNIPHEGYLPEANTRLLSRISWSSIFAGVLIAIVVQLLLSLLGIGIGLSTIDAVSENSPAKGLGMGSAIWYGLSAIIALAAGGWVAGRLTRFTGNTDAFIHGLLTWSIVTLLTLYLITTTIGNIIGGASRMIGGVARMAGSGVAAMAPGAGKELKSEMKEQGFDLSDLKSEANLLLDSNAKGDKGLAGNVVDRIFGEKKSDGKINREDAIEATMRQTGKSRAESTKIVDELIQKYEQANQKFQETKKEAEVKARQIADDAAAGASKGAFFAFFGFVLSALAAGFASKFGCDSRLRHD